MSAPAPAPSSSSTIDEQLRLRIAEELAGSGADEIVFADTVGVGVPHQVSVLVLAADAHAADRPADGRH